MQTALERQIKKQIKAPLHSFFAVVRPGFEAVACKELQSILPNCQPIITEGGIEFEAKLEEMWLVHLKAFCLSSVRMRITQFRAGTEGEFASKVKSIAWPLYLPQIDELKLKISSRLHHCRIEKGVLLENILLREVLHSLKQNSAFVPEEANLEQKLYIMGKENQFTLSIECSGKGFYQRGYRKAIGEAPLRETTAALMLQAVHFEDYAFLYDPMCGSGTFTLETLAMSHHIIPGKEREFPFSQWPSFRKSAYHHLIKTLSEAQNSPTGPLCITSDINTQVLNAAASNLESLNQQHQLDLQPSKDFFLQAMDLFNAEFWKEQQNEGRLDDALIILNPPYGKRIVANQDLYSKIGQWAKTYWKKAAIAIIVPGEIEEKAFCKEIQRKIKEKILFFNGGLKCAFLIL